ncbi:MAG: chemotaxis-specific protein-glutamate methyltransferase CheB [Verrucomicrobiota bacterium]
MKIAIVNDMAMACEALRRVIDTRPDLELIWTAHDGEEAVLHAKTQHPDILLMDLRMPRMNGSEATARIMAEAPCAIIVVTANVQDNLDLVFEAMSSGALDAVSTPQLGRNGVLLGGNELLHKIDTVGSLIRTHRAPLAPSVADVPMPYEASSSILVIGASTGGPQAVATILGQLPENFAPGVAVVQHVDEQFAPGLADWLDTRCALEVRAAHDGAPMRRGTVWLAATNNHMVMEPDLTLHYHSQPLESHYRPSVDVFFKSVAHQPFERGCGVLLTGMGKDGAAGLKRLHEQGFRTYAQNEASCVVYGMPQAAHKLGAVDHLMPPEQIGRSILNFFAAKTA